MQPTKEEIKRVMGTWGRIGGKAKTPAKIAAVRKNGKLGGRPRKKSAKVLRASL